MQARMIEQASRRSGRHEADTPPDGRVLLCSQHLRGLIKDYRRAIPP